MLAIGPTAFVSYENTVQIPGGQLGVLFVGFTMIAIVSSAITGKFPE